MSADKDFPSVAGLITKAFKLIKESKGDISLDKVLDQVLGSVHDKVLVFAYASWRDWSERFLLTKDEYSIIEKHAADITFSYHIGEGYETEMNWSELEKSVITDPKEIRDFIWKLDLDSSYYGTGKSKMFQQLLGDHQCGLCNKARVNRMKCAKCQVTVGVCCSNLILCVKCKPLTVIQTETKNP